MQISALTSSASSVSSLVSSVYQPPSVQAKSAAKSSTSGQSNFGPAYLLGSSTQKISQGLYSSLGTRLGVAQAQAAASGAATSSPASEQRNDALNSIAETIDAGNTSGARDQAEQLLAKYPNDVTALRLIGHSYVAEQRYKQAERYYARAASLAPGSARVAGELANARALRGSDDEVLDEATRKIKSATHRDDGLRLLLHLSDRSPDNAEVYLALADGYTAAGRPVQVIGALQEAVRVADADEMSQVIDRARNLASDYPNVGLTHNILGRALQKAGRLDEGIEELKAAVNTAPTSSAYVSDLASGYITRARDSLEAGDTVSAQGDLATAQSIDPANSGISDVSARVAAELARDDLSAGRYKQGFAKLTTATFRMPDDPDFKKQVAGLYTFVGAHFKTEGDDSLALSSYAKAYELDPTSASARQNVSQLGSQLGAEAIEDKDYDAAISYLGRAVNASPTNEAYRQDLAEAYDLRGQMRVTLGEIDDAIADYRAGATLDPSNTTIVEHLSQALALAD